jgi:hypothetical protein
VEVEVMMMVASMMAHYLAVVIWVVLVEHHVGAGSRICDGPAEDISTSYKKKITCITWAAPNPKQQYRLVAMKKRLLLLPDW